MSYQDWLNNNKDLFDADIDARQDDSTEFSKGLKGSFAGLSTLSKAAYGAVMDDETMLLQAELDREEDQQYAGDTENFSDIGSLGDAGDWVAYQAGNATGSLIQVAAGGGIGGAAAKGLAKEAGKKALKEQIKVGVERKTAKAMAQQAARKVSNRGVMAGATATGYPQQLGENVMAMKADRGGQLEDGDVGVAAVTATLQSALDVMPFMSALNKTGLGDKARSEIIGGLAKTSKLNQLGKDLGGLALQEGTTEAVQQALQIGALEWVNSNKDHFTVKEITELMDSFAAGAVGGVVIGGAPAAMNAYQADSPWLSDTQTERLNKTKDALSTGYDAAKQGLRRGENQSEALTPSVEQPSSESVATHPPSYQSFQENLKPPIAPNTTNPSPESVGNPVDYQQFQQDLSESIPDFEVNAEKTTSQDQADSINSPQPIVEAQLEDEALTEHFTQEAVLEGEYLPFESGTDLVAAPKRQGITIESEFDRKAHEAATSPLNDLPEPSDKQKEAGNYKVGKLSLHGLSVAIENPRGSIRKGINAKGERWQNEMMQHYGYFGGTKGKDGDAVDAFFSPQADNPKLPVFVVDQVNPKTKQFDEHKVMVGFESEQSARDAYLSNYDKNWQGLGQITPFSLENFKQWLKDKKHTKVEAANSELALPKPIAELTSPEPDNHTGGKLDDDLLAHLPPNLSIVGLARDIALLSSKGKQPTDEAVGKALVEAAQLISQGKYQGSEKLAQKVLSRSPDEQLTTIRNTQRQIKEKLKENQTNSTTEAETASSSQVLPQTNNQPEKGLSPIQLATHYAMQNEKWLTQLQATNTDDNLLLSPELNQIAMDALANIAHGDYSTTPAFKRQAIERLSHNDKYEKFKKLLIKSSQKRLKEQAHESSTAGNLESNRPTSHTPNKALSEPVSSDGLRNDGRSTGRGVEDVRATGVRNQRDQSVSPARSTTSGKQSHQPVDQPDRKPTVEKPTARDSGRGGTTDTGTTRKPSTKRGRADSAPDVSPEQQYQRSVDQLKRLPKKAAPEPDASFLAKVEQQKQAENIEYKANDLANIQATLPILLPEQQSDVAFAEARFAQKEAHGVLFTNGTGTGKTFTGLGIAKRFARQGKGNILIVVPSDKIARDWVKSAKHFQLEVKQLKDTQDNGESGAVVTTYANFGANPALLQRNWDLILPDESHRINSNKAGNYTHAERQLNDLSGKNTGDYNYRWKAVDYDKYVKLRKATDKLKAKNGDAPTQYVNFRDYFKSPTHHIVGAVPAAFEKLHARWERLNAAAKKRREKAQKQGIQRAKVTFLSATPFAYHKSLRYADGYLFDSSTYNKGQSGYNVATGFDALLEQEFGYRMRSGKLNQPEADVDVAMGEREFNEKLKKAGVLSGRRLKVDADYSREFVLIDEGVGRKIDEGIRILSEQSDTYPNLSQQLHKNFGYLERLTLLESIKAQAAIDRIKEHLAMGRKVVVFHSYKVAKGINPFDFKPSEDVSHDTIKRFAQDHPTIANIHYDTHSSPDYAIAEAFGDQAVVFNGSVDKRQRRDNVDAFNTDGSGVDVIVVQREAGKEGISLHDTTGEHQRVLIDLGLPVRPTDAIQTEGRIYRTGVKTNAIIEYLATGLDYESHAFGQSVAQRSSTAENLALGNEGRNLLKAFVSAYQEANENAPHQEQGVGGKEGDFMNNEVSPMEQAKFEYFKRAKNTKTRDNREGKDYFATPEPVGLKMVEWLNLRAGEKALEPSAGHGAIAKWFPDNTKNIFIEQSYSLSGQVSMLGNGEVRTQNFLDLGTNNKFDGIAMNPPYGHGGHDAIQHLEKAFKHLRDGGRVIALIPEGGLATKRFDSFYENLKDGHLIADVGLPRVTFERAGTAVKTRIVVLDKVPELWRDAGAKIATSRKLDFNHADTVKELFEHIDEVSLSERVTKPSDTALNAALEERKRKRKNSEPDNPVFSRDTSSVSTPDTIISTEEARSVVERFTAAIGKRGTRVELVDSALDLPPAVHKRIAQEGFDAAEIRGVHYDKTAYIVRNQSKHTSAQAIEETIYHEVYGHEGFRRLFGAEIGSKFKHLFGALGGRKGINQLATRHGFKLDNYWSDWEKSGMPLAHRQLFLVDELLAHLAQKQAVETLPQKVLRKLKELYGAIRAWLRDHNLINLAKYNDADLQHLLKQARAAAGDAKKKRYVPRFFRNPVFSKAPPSEGLSASGADWSEVDRDAPKQGKERLKELVSKSLQWVKDNAQDFAKSGGLASVTLRQLVDLSEHILPSTKHYMNRVEQMLTARNQMQDEAAQLAQRWQKLDKTIKHRLAHVMHQATLHGNDPSDAEFTRRKVLIRGGIEAVKAQLDPENNRYKGDYEPVEVEANDSNLKLLAKKRYQTSKAFRNARGSKDNIALKKDAMKKAEDEWRNMRNALAEDKKRQQHFKPLQRLFNDLPKEAREIFTDSRDMYLARSKRTEAALLQSFEDANLNRTQKEKATRLIRLEFETARLKGIYFPLHRKGQFFVRAEVARDDLKGGVSTYTKKAQKIDELISRVTGEVRYQLRDDGRTFDSYEEAEAIAGTWHTEEAALASANSRADLVGKHLVAVQQGKGYVLQDNPNEKLFMMFATEAEAKRAQEQLDKEGALDSRIGKVTESNFKDDNVLSGTFLGQAFGVMREAGVDEQVQDNVYQLFLEQLPELSQRKHAIHRKKVKGFSEDALQAFSHNMMHQAHQISKLESRDELRNLIDAVKAEAAESSDSDAVFAGRVRDELSKRHEWVMNPSNAQWTNWTSGFGFVMYLGLSPAAALVNLTQTAVVAYPTLAAEFGWKDATKQLQKAASQLNMRQTVMGDDAVDEKLLNRDEQEALKHWRESGVIDKSQAHMLAGIGDSDSLTNSPAYQNAMGKIAHLFHKAEIVNREVTLLSAYRLAHARGDGFDKAVGIASDMTWQSQFDYSNANRARFMQNDAAKLLLMFKSYSQHMIYYMMRNAHNWGKGGKEGKKAQTRLLGMLAVTAALGGASALPIGAMGLATAGVYGHAKHGAKKTAVAGVGVLSLLFMASMLWDEEEDWGTLLRAELRSMGGDSLESLVFRGVVNTATGINVSSRISLDSLLIRDPNRELEGRDLATHYLKEAAGPVLGYGVNLGSVYQLWSEDHGYRAAEQLMPKAIRDVMKTARLTNEGALNMRGDTQLDSDLFALPYSQELNLWNLFWQANGFGAEKLSRQYQKNTDLKNAEKRLLRQRGAILRRYYMAYLEKDFAEMRQQKQLAKQWSNKNPKAKPLDDKAFARSLKTRLRYRKSSMNGVNISNSFMYLADELYM